MGKTIYIKNNRHYATKIVVTKDNAERTFDFDCFRQYDDTGNVATTGITSIAQEDHEWLLTNVPVYSNLFKSGDFAVSKSDGISAMIKNTDLLAAENERLKAELAAKTEEASLATSEEMTRLSDENASLKAELEALKKKASGKKVEKEDF